MVAKIYLNAVFGWKNCVFASSLDYLTESLKNTTELLLLFVFGVYFYVLVFLLLLLLVLVIAVCYALC